jgi:hypothetical protein
MLDYLNLGSTPSDEDCAQVGSPDYENRANKELDAYMAQLERMFPGLETHKSMRFKKMWFPHDFGSYGEIVIVYDADNELEAATAIEIEWNTPTNWDEEAIKELNLTTNKENAK